MPVDPGHTFILASENMKMVTTTDMIAAEQRELQYSTFLRADFDFAFAYRPEAAMAGTYFKYDGVPLLYWARRRKLMKGYCIHHA